MIAIIGVSKDDILYFQAKMENAKEETIPGGYKVYKGKIFREDCVLSYTGPSLSDAAVVTALIIDKYDPYIIFNIGAVYSFNDQLRQGDIYIADRYYFAEVDFTANKEGIYGQIPGGDPFYVADHSLNEKAEKSAYLMTTRYVQRGFLLSGSFFNFSPKAISDVVQSHFIIQEDNMRAYDNVSASIALVCHRNNVALLTIKAVAMQMGKEREKFNYVRSSLEAMPTIGKIITRILVSRTEEILND